MALAAGALPETFRVDFVTDLRGNPADSGQLITVIQLTATTSSRPLHREWLKCRLHCTSGSTINIAAFDDPDGNNIVGDGVKDMITGVVIRFGSKHLRLH